MNRGRPNPGPSRARTGTGSFRPTALAPGKRFLLGGTLRRVADVAALYEPRLFRRRSEPSPPLLWTGYEAFPEGDDLLLVYYPVWEDEVHPSPALHAVYRSFRRLYYGSALDVEYVQVRLRGSDGALRELRFETSLRGVYAGVIVRHAVARLRQEADRTFTSRLSRGGRTHGIERLAGLPLEGNRVGLVVQTWNHLWRLAGDGEPGLVAVEATLRPLTLGDYRTLRLARRSQGDVRDEAGRPEAP